MNIGIFTNSQKPIGLIVEDLTAKADDIFIASAYISRKAVDTLVQRANLSQGSHLKKVDILVGIVSEMGDTALDALLVASQKHPGSFNVRYTKSNSGRLFHPKVYYFQCGQISHIIIASANFTQQGQYQNEEMYCYIECSASDRLAEQINAIRQAWLAEPFSARLEAELVGLFDKLGAADAAKKAINEIVRITGGPIVIPIPLLSSKERLLKELEKGYLFSTDFSVAPLSVSVPIREAQRIDGADGAVSIHASLTASVQLLPLTTLNEFTQLYRDAKKVVEQHSIHVPSGLYVTPSAQASFTKNMKAVQIRYEQLVQKHIRLRRPINSHLVHLATDCTKEWQKHSNQPGIVTEKEFFLTAKERIKERREMFSNDPHSAVRLTISPYPHPLIYRANNPNHAINKLYETELDDDLLTTMLAISIGQVDLIIDATKKKQQPAVKDDYKCAKLLISFRGKVIDGLLTELNRIASKDWGKSKPHGKAKLLTPGQRMIQDLNKLREQAEVHKRLLEGYRRVKPQEAFDLLLKDYPTVGQPA